MSFFSKFLSVAVAASTMLTTSFNKAMPQMDINGTLFLINRDHMISELYEPQVREAKVSGSVRAMRDDAATALEQLFAAAKKSGKVSLVSVSGYRSFTRQKNIYNNKVKSVGSVEKANEYVAIPGASEHQLGLAMDIGTSASSGLTERFGATKAGIWVAENAWQYGFIIRYQKGWEDITGYNYEPWHIRYVGKEHAQALKDIPYEEYVKHLQKQALLDIIK